MYSPIKNIHWTAAHEVIKNSRKQGRDELPLHGLAFSSSFCCEQVLILRLSKLEARNPAKCCPIEDILGASEGHTFHNPCSSSTFLIFAKVYNNIRKYDGKLHPWNPTWHRKTPISNRNYIFKWWMFQCHVRFRGGNITNPWNIRNKEHPWCNSSEQWPKTSVKFAGNVGGYTTHLYTGL